jgi:hypothetical protein
MQNIKITQDQNAYVFSEFILKAELNLKWIPRLIFFVSEFYVGTQAGEL